MRQTERSWGSRLLVRAAALAALVAIVNYFMPGNGISGTYGALLVIASSVALMLVGRMIARRLRQRNVLLHLVALVLLAGTAFAGWLLEAYLFFLIIVLAALGWLWMLFRPRTA